MMTERQIDCSVPMLSRCPSLQMQHALVWLAFVACWCVNETTETYIVERNAFADILSSQTLSQRKQTLQAVVLVSSIMPCIFSCVDRRMRKQRAGYVGGGTAVLQTGNGLRTFKCLGCFANAAIACVGQPDLLAGKSGRAYELPLWHSVCEEGAPPLESILSHIGTNQQQVVPDVQPVQKAEDSLSPRACMLTHGQSSILDRDESIGPMTPRRRRISAPDPVPNPCKGNTIPPSRRRRSLSQLRSPTLMTSPAVP